MHGARICNADPVLYVIWSQKSRNRRAWQFQGRCQSGRQDRDQVRNRNEEEKESASRQIVSQRHRALYFAVLV